MNDYYFNHDDEKYKCPECGHSMVYIQSIGFCCTWCDGTGHKDSMG